MERIGSKIRGLRKRNGWSQKDVAVELKMSIPAFSKIECGITDLNLSRLEQIASVFNVSLVELFRFNEIEIEQNQSEIDRVNEKLEARDREILELQAKMISLFEQLRQSSIQPKEHKRKLSSL